MGGRKPESHHGSAVHGPCGSDQASQLVLGLTGPGSQGAGMRFHHKLT